MTAANRKQLITPEPVSPRKNSSTVEYATATPKKAQTSAMGVANLFFATAFTVK